MIRVPLPADQETADIHPERLQQYISHIERLLLNKCREVSELQRIMELNVENILQKQVEHNHVMIHQARYAAMGEMLGTVAHQWRQPLHAISLIIQNMQDAWEFGEFSEEFLDRSVIQAMEKIMYLTRTIDDFRTFLNPVKSAEYFSPLRCVDECVGLLSGWFTNFPAIDVHKNDGVEEFMRIAGCQNAFKQVLINLLNNANDAVSKQQRFATAFRGRITIDIQCSNNEAIIGVADNGGGIDASAMGQIFEPYFTTKDKTNGIGLGLYISRLIIENNLNGCLWAENIPEGALFSIRLPIAMNDGGHV
jgi:signal transduction histidine kinase